MQAETKNISGNLQYTRPGSRPRMLRFGRLIRIMLMCYSLLVTAWQPANDSATEYKLKAAFLYNFIQYIDWGSTPTEYVVAILGNSPIDVPLQEIAHTQNGKRIVVKHFNSLNEITNCNVLFIPKDTSIPLSEVLARLPRGVLTVAEKPGCARQGAAINFVIIDNKLRFESNLQAINSAGLKASSQLLKLAILVGSK